MLLFLPKLKVIIFMHTECLENSSAWMPVLSARNGVELNYEKMYTEAEACETVSGLILNACPGRFVVSDFLQPRRFKQIGAIVSLQNFPKTERIAPNGTACVSWGMGIFVASFLGREKSSVPPILCSRPPERGYLKMLGFLKRP